MEEVESGLVHAAESVYTEYSDPRRDAWETVVAALRRVPLKRFEQMRGKSRRLLIDARHGRTRPHLRHQKLLISVARTLGDLE